MTIFFAVAVVGLLATAGLAVDGGAKVRAAERADRVAAEAARSAGQGVDLSSLLSGEPVAVDRRSALAGARSYLDDAGVQGSVVLLEGGRTVRVETVATEDTVFLALIGIPRFTVTGRAEVRLTIQREGAR